WRIKHQNAFQNDHISPVDLLRFLRPETPQISLPSAGNHPKYKSRYAPASMKYGDEMEIKSVPRMSGKVVNWNCDAFALFEFDKSLRQQIPIEGIGMIKVVI